MNESTYSNEINEEGRSIELNKGYEREKYRVEMRTIGKSP